MNPNPDPAAHQEIAVWNAETGCFEDYEVGARIRSIRRTVTEGEMMAFAALTMDLHPYAADAVFAAEQGVFGARIVPGALIFSIGLGLVATNNERAFSYGYDRLRFIKPVFVGDTIYTIRTVLGKEPKTDDRGLVRVSYEVFRTDGTLVLYCEHLQTIAYRDPARARDAAAAGR